MDFAMIGLVLSAAGNFVQYLLGRRQRDAETAKDSASATLDSVKAADLLVRNLTEQYRASVEKQTQMATEMAAMHAELVSLREEVADLSSRFEAVERLVSALPSDLQEQFADVMRPKPRRKSPAKA